MRRACALLAAAALVAGCGSQATGAAPGPKTATDSAYAFLDGYVDPDGRVVRRDQGGDTVSEGQAYAMLAAAGVGDGKRFDTIWGWTKANLQQASGLLAFHWASGKVVDPQPASDADLDAARALLVAGCRFKRPDLKQAGLRIGRAVLANETANSVLVAGPWAAKPPVTFDPSYYAPRTLAMLGPEATRVDDATRGALQQVMNPLPPDWAQLSGGRATPIPKPGQQGPGTYGFDAPRTLVRLAEAPDRASRALAAKAWPSLQKHPAQTPVALAGAAGAAAAAGDSAAADRLLAMARASQQRPPSYYGAGVIALASLELQTKLLQATC